MNHLFRELAPIAEEAWAQIDDDARARLTTYLGGRRLIDFRGPLGWDASAVNLGRVGEIATPPSGVVPGATFEMGLRTVLPLVEIRAPFTLSRAALDAAARGDAAVDLDALDAAARAIATMENVAVFHGWSAAGIAGVAPSSPHAPITVAPGGGTEGAAAAVATAVERLALAGVGGPYGLALGDESWVGVQQRVEGGVTLHEHLGRILDGGPIVWVPGVDGGVVVSRRGGDFELVSGQDMAVGYRSADGATVTLYLEESFTLQVRDPTAAIAVVS